MIVKRKESADPKILVDLKNHQPDHFSPRFRTSNNALTTSLKDSPAFFTNFNDSKSSLEDSKKSNERKKFSPNKMVPRAQISTSSITSVSDIVTKSKFIPGRKDSSFASLMGN